MPLPGEGIWVESLLRRMWAACGLPLSFHPTGCFTMTEKQHEEGLAELRGEEGTTPEAPYDGSSRRKRYWKKVREI